MFEIILILNSGAFIEGVTVMNRSKITLNYFQGRFWIHLITTLSLFIEFQDYIIIKLLFLVRL
jgi:hypothetical protein